MSEYVVTEAFQDKFTKVHHPKQSAYQCEDPERVAFLQEGGFIGEQIQNEPEEKPKVKKAKKSPSEE
jgi:hypothetical protein